MKRFFIYSMLILLVSEATPLHQLIKIPKLYEHFIEHNNLNPTVDFITYLSMHYWGEDLDDDDDIKDMQLPFKRFDINTPSFLFVPAGKIFTAKTQYWPIEPLFCASTPQVYFNPALEALFRPPRA